MSDEVNEDGGEAASSGSGGSSMVGDLGPGERLVAAGGAAAVLVFVIFELIAREYFVSTMLLVCASLPTAEGTRLRNGSPTLPSEPSVTRNVSMVERSLQGEFRLGTSDELRIQV